MGNKKLGIIFLATVILTFFAGYFSNQVIDLFPSRKSNDLFEYINSEFEKYYYYDLSDQDKHEAFIQSIEAIIQTYAKNNQDPYTRLVSSPVGSSPQNLEAYEGMGITIFQEVGFLTILDVNPDGPAHGLLFPNDKILGIQVNGVAILFSELNTFAEMTNLISGKKDDVKRLIILDPMNNPYEVEIKLDEILTPSVTTLDLNQTNLGYIRVHRFNPSIQNVSIGTASLFLDLLNDIEKQFSLGDISSKTLIIDLRNNPGGALNALSRDDESSVPGITQQLIKRNLDQPIFSINDNKGVLTHYYGGLLQKKPYQIVVLVNEQSASAAEVLAASLKSEGYLVYGQNTYGKGVYQNTRNLFTINGIQYSLTLTEGKWFYDQDKNVMDDPIDVIPIDQTGIQTSTLPIFYKTLFFNQVEDSLILYQKFLNIYLNLELRTDGYFDSSTLAAVKQFQTQNGLDSTGILDLATARAIHLEYHAMKKNIYFDLQLQALIEVLISS